MYMALQTTGGRTTTWYKGETVGQRVKTRPPYHRGGARDACRITGGGAPARANKDDQKGWNKGDERVRRRDAKKKRETGLEKQGR